MISPLCLGVLYIGIPRANMVNIGVKRQPLVRVIGRVVHRSQGVLVNDPTHRSLTFPARSCLLDVWEGL